MVCLSADNCSGCIGKHQLAWPSRMDWVFITFDRRTIAILDNKFIEYYLLNVFPNIERWTKRQKNILRIFIQLIRTMRKLFALNVRNKKRWFCIYHHFCLVTSAGKTHTQSTKYQMVQVWVNATERKRGKKEERNEKKCQLIYGIDNLNKIFGQFNPNLIAIGLGHLFEGNALVR